MHPTLKADLEAGKGVNVVAVARAANVSPATLYRAIARGEIEVTQIGKRRTIPPHVARRLLHLPEPA